MGKAILTLDTIAPDRDFIVIDGKSYQLRGDDELSLTEVAKIRQLSKTVLTKDIGEDSTEQDIEVVEDYANQVLGMIVLGLPADVRDRLSATQKFAVVRAFSAAASSRRARAAAGDNGGPPTTAASSPGSSGSTGETLATG